MTDSPIICQFDQTAHASLVDLHAHLRRFKVSQKLYYTTYHPRTDRLTGEAIPYKDREQYLSAEFSSKTNLKKWLSKNKEEGLKWAKEWLIKRRAEKGLIYAPSQVELRTLMCPSMPYYEAMAAHEGGYYGMTNSLGFTPRYANTTLSFATLPPDAVVLQDSREQKPLKLACATREEALEVGDYALAPPHDLGIRIERKSLPDFCGTMSGRKVEFKNKKKAARVDSSLERFDRELARARDAGLYVIMLVESDINDVNSIGYLPQTRHVQASASYILHNLRDLLVKYPLTFQALFVAGRPEMVRVMMRIFQLGLQVKTTDLQFATEEGRL